MSITNKSDLGREPLLEINTPDEKDPLARANELLAELEHFAEHLEDAYEDYYQEVPMEMHIGLCQEVQCEIESLKIDRLYHDSLSAHRLASSNLPYFQAIWNTAKVSRNIVKLRCPVFGGPFKHRVLAPGIRIDNIISPGGSEPKRKKASHSVRIDVVSDGGLSWYKVSTITNRRLLIDMAKGAVSCGDSDNDDSTHGAIQNYLDVPLLKLASKLKKVAQGHQIRHTSPTPCLVLPRLFEGRNAEVDKVIESCRFLGVRVACGNALASPSPLSKDLLSIMIPSPRKRVTPKLNVDISVMIALISDISHSALTKQPYFGQHQNDHIDIEAADPIIPQFCSLFNQRPLVCTKEAARCLARIVHTIGTVKENERAHLILTPDDSMTPEQRLSRFEALSIHSRDILSSLQLPILIVDTDTMYHDQEDSEDSAHAYVQKVLSYLGQSGKSVFSYGWLEGLTTVTFAVAAIKQMERRLEEAPKPSALLWPSIWVYQSSRPLIGVAKGSNAKRMRKHVGDCRVACMCGLEEFSEE
ncbi:hypothetical protein GGS21DRAFT_515782 [Xylaria nigripes]|nr:hypothetical protein GGS21DRAFT_515782 [Xylaria nigripes]